MYHLEGPCFVQSHTKPYLTTILASAFLMCSKNNFWIGIVYQKTRVTLESFDCAIRTWSILNYKFLGDKNWIASIIKHKTKHFNMTRILHFDVILNWNVWNMCLPFSKVYINLIMKWICFLYLSIFNMTRTYTHQNVYPSFNREWQIPLLCKTSIKYKRITLLKLYRW